MSMIDDAASRVSIDQILFFHRNEADGKQIVDKAGKRILPLLPGLIDTKAVISASFYANCISYYLDSNLDRNSMETITIMIDVREGTDGCPNVPAYKMIGFLRTIVKVFESNFPERLHKVIDVAFPVPLILKGLVNTIKMLFDPTTAKKLTLATGSAPLADSPLPKKELLEHIDEEILDQTEKVRLIELVQRSREVIRVVFFKDSTRSLLFYFDAYLVGEGSLNYWDVAVALKHS